MVWHQDEPFRSTSIYAQWQVFKLTKDQGVKVILDGQGADELFAVATAILDPSCWACSAQETFAGLLMRFGAFSVSMGIRLGIFYSSS